MGTVSMLVVCVAVIFSLVSVSQTAPVSQTCETLLKPLEMKTIDPLIGDWSMVASIYNRTGARTLLKFFLDNMLLQISPETLPNMFKVTHNWKAWDGTCSSSNHSMTLEDNKFKWTYIVSSSTVFLPTCPDCLLMQTTTTTGNTYMSLELISKRRELSAAELLQFKTQVDCLNLPAAVFLNTKTEHCLDTAQWIPDVEDKYIEFMKFMENEHVKAFFSVTDYLIEKAECLGWI